MTLDPTTPPKTPRAPSSETTTNPGRRSRRRRKAQAPSAANHSPERLHKVLARTGFGSLRDMESAIAAGRVTVNGKLADPGQPVKPGDRVRMDGHPIKLHFDAPVTRVIVYHKPEGEVVTRNDPEGRPTVFDHMPRLQGAKWNAVGRLDLNSEGLLVLTTDGGLANRLMHPRYGIDREYSVRVLGELTEEMHEQLIDGVLLDDGLARFDSVDEAGGEGANRWYRVVLKEGRNREVRRMFEAVGLTVSRLIRIRYGPLILPPQLRRGQFRELTPDEVAALNAIQAETSLHSEDAQHGLHPGSAPVPAPGNRRRKTRPQGTGRTNGNLRLDEERRNAGSKPARQRGLNPASRSPRNTEPSRSGAPSRGRGYRSRNRGNPR